MKKIIISALITILLVCLCFFDFQKFIGFAAISGIVLAVFIIVEIKKAPTRAEDHGNDNKSSPTIDDHKNNNQQYIKKPLLSESEKIFYNKLLSILKEKYLIQSQIPLSSVVKKIGTYRYANELYRTIDFGVFDEDFNILLLIELNDATHETLNRKYRDKKVKEILTSANIPLLTFWTREENNITYLFSRISKYISL